MTPKVSVVIPVYNVNKYISKCLDSVVNQTFENIEIICVNDCSTDNSLDILNEYSKKDRRVVIIDKIHNEGTMLARKSGVEAAKGDYIVFIDADDYIDTNLCQFISDVTEKEDADIIHFSSGVYDEISDKKIKAMEEDLKPLEKTLVGDEILEHAFIKRAFATQIWGKAFKADLCKEACSVLPEEHCYVGEDVFTTFIFCCFAKKYIGIKTPDYYFYRFGIGVSGQSMIKISKFEMFAKMANWIKYTQEYFDSFGANEIQRKSCDAMKERLFADCCEIYRHRVSEKDKISAEDLIYKYWHCFEIGDSDWINNIGKSKDYLKKQFEISEYIKDAPAFKNINAKVSVIVYIRNDADTLENKLNGIFDQSLRDVEYILINDGSEDESLKTINRYAATNDRVTVINQKYRGLSVAANKAIAIAKGKYIYFADINKKFNKDFIEKAYSEAEINNVNILSFDGIYEDKYISGEKFLLESVNEDINLGDLSTKLFNSDFVKNSRVLFNENIKNSTEIFIVMLMAQAKEVFCLPKYTIKESVNEKYKFTAEEFIENFIIYTNLSASNIVGQYSDITKKAISDICKKYHNISNEIYLNLSEEQIRMINKVLPEEYKPLFFNTRELRNLKKSMPYRLSKKVISIIDKILKK